MVRGKSCTLTAGSSSTLVQDVFRGGGDCLTPGGHCRQFAPTWEKLVKSEQYLERIAGFHMAQVDCLAQGDLCGANNIKGCEWSE